VRDLGLIVVDESTTAATSRKRRRATTGANVAVVRAQQAAPAWCSVRPPRASKSRYNVERRKYTLLELPARIEDRPMPLVELIDMRQEFLETRKQATFSRKLEEASDSAWKTASRPSCC